MRRVAPVLLVLLGCAEEGPVAPAADPATVEEPAPLDALSRRFGRIRARLRERGYDERDMLPRVFLLEGEGAAVPLDLPVGECSTLVALAGGSLRQLEVTLHDGEGDDVAANAVEGEGALVHVCPPEAAGAPPTLPYYLVFMARGGSGTIAAAAFASAAGAGRGFDGLFDGVVAPRVAFQEVEERLAEARATLRARGLLPIGEPRLERVTEGEVLRQSVEVEPGRCYVAAARGGEGVRDVDLYLFDPTGAEVARDLGSDASPSLEHCPGADATGRYTIEVRAFEGAGAVGLSLLAGPAPETIPPEGAAAESAEPPAPGDTDPAARIAALAAPLGERGYGSPRLVVHDGWITPGEVRTIDTVIGPGCAIVIGAAMRAGVDLDLYLGDAAGHPLDSDTRVEPTARVVACPDGPVVHRVTVKAYGPEGSYALATLRAPPAIQDVRSLRLEEAVAQLRTNATNLSATWPLELTDEQHELESGERWSRSVVLAAGHCLGFAAAGDASVEDVDVFIRDSTDRPVASESGPAPWAAVLRCAEQEETLTLEVLAYRGAGLVAARTMWGAP